LICLASPAYAVKTLTFSWEDGSSTVLGVGSPAAVNITNVTGAQTGLCGSCTGGSYSCPGAYDGSYYLHLAESPHSGTPIAWIACVTGLQYGDLVTASFRGYDITVGASPSLRIWGGYHDAIECPGCPGTYISSAGGPGDEGYTTGNGWDISQYTWTYSRTDGYALVIQVRLYSVPTSGTYTTDYWVDYVSVTVPDYASVRFPDFGPSATENSSWGAVKALYR
jgi:hypothetical protein